MHPSITTIYGEPGTIKSSIAITWPKPIAFYDLESGGHRAWGFNELVEAGDITVRTFAVPHHSMITRYEKLSGYMEAWKALTSAMEADLQTFETVVWDTGTVVWALDRDAFLQEIQTDNPGRKQLQQIEYGEPNRRITELFNLSRAFQTNLVITHHETDEYITLLDPMGRPIVDENNRPVSVSTNNKVPEGFKHTVGLSDWVLRTTIAEVTKDGKVTPVPQATIDKSAYGLFLRRQVIDWPTYNKLVALASPPTPEGTA
tara:strand:+ start:4602 stop:5378 length:777 start_codon:yes stop_codon:yes gene_type:complete